MRPLIVLFALASAPAALAAQTCDEPHWRWTEKTEQSLATKIPVRTTITRMLTQWGVPEMYAGNASKCRDRSARELTTYSVYGWVRRVKKGESDGDWHIELTASRTGAAQDRCIVAEIPPPEDGAQYRVARNQFDAILSDAGVTVNSSGDLSAPVRMKVVGAAFFDAEHRGARGTTNPPHGHGRCNSSSRALWELHPVYGVFKP